METRKIICNKLDSVVSASVLNVDRVNIIVCLLISNNYSTSTPPVLHSTTTDCQGLCADERIQLKSCQVGGRKFPTQHTASKRKTNYATNCRFASFSCITIIVDQWFSNLRHLQFSSLSSPSTLTCSFAKNACNRNCKRDRNRSNA